MSETAADARLTQLLLLAPGWDSYGARDIDPECVRLARGLVRWLAPVGEPSVAPTARGGVQLEWHGGGVDVEVEVRGPGDVVLSFEDAKLREGGRDDAR